MFLVFSVAQKDPALPRPLWLSPHSLPSRCKGHLVFTELTSLGSTTPWPSPLLSPLPRWLLSPQLPPPDHFHHFIIFTISILGQRSPLWRLPHPKLPPFPHPLLVSFHLPTCKTITFISSLGCNLRQSLPVLFSATSLVSQTVPGMAFQKYLWD